MSKKIDYKKDYKFLYLSPKNPEILEVPSIPFFAIEGTGDPNKEEFARATEALYNLSYAVKMSYKSEDVPEGYYEYTVFPLEGIWDLIDYSKPSTDKSNLKYKIMVRQPDFLTMDGFQRFLSATKQKKRNPKLDEVRFEQVEDGLSCQMMHIGSYDDEPTSFARMEAFCTENGWTRKSKLHREIYISDPRKTAPEKRKTVLRFGVEK